MRDLGLTLHVEVQGRSLLVPGGDLREVLPFPAVHPLPSPVAGLSGVVFHQGEFLPLLDWDHWPLSLEPRPVEAPLLGVLKRRLGLPFGRLRQVEDLGRTPLEPLLPQDPWNPLLMGTCAVRGETVPVLDVEKLLGLLQNRSLRR